jgi:hypothetical protein
VSICGSLVQAYEMRNAGAVIQSWIGVMSGYHDQPHGQGVSGMPYIPSFFNPLLKN